MLKNVRFIYIVYTILDSIKITFKNYEFYHNTAEDLNFEIFLKFQNEYHTSQE